MFGDTTTPRAAHALRAADCRKNTDQCHTFASRPRRADRSEGVLQYNNEELQEQGLQEQRLFSDGRV